MVRVCTINQNNFKRFSNLDLKYKLAIINGVHSKYQFTPKLENLDSIVTPSQLKFFLTKLKPENFSLGSICFKKPAEITDIENLQNGVYKANLHVHTKYSDGTMDINDYLEQSRKYADKVANISPDDALPFYISSITDHNNFEGVQEAIAQIVEEPKKFKNFKFVPGCEFMFNDEKSSFEFTAFEAVGLCFNPFDTELMSSLSKFNPIEMINKIKEFGGILSYAHPIRYCQGNGVEPKFIEYLKKIGINGIESNYQYINFQNDDSIKYAIQEVRNIAKDNSFWQTGGTDTHSKNIFHAKVKNLLDKIV